MGWRWGNYTCVLGQGGRAKPRGQIESGQIGAGSTPHEGRNDNCNHNDMRVHTDQLERRPFRNIILMPLNFNGF